MYVLGIESSCDDTAIAVVRFANHRFSIVAQVTASQVLTHRKYGGVVPEVAAREHAITILPTLEAALTQAKTPWHKIDAIAVTGGPGLNTALLVGVETARTLGYMLHKPIVRVNHIEGHVMSGVVQANLRSVRLPALALIVSGGHTELIRVTAWGKYRLLGRTLDDAVGEAFDKTAKILGLPYPGGPEISHRAQHGNDRAFAFPRSLLNRESLDFSYSGLKTAVLYELQKHRRSARLVNDIAASFQAAAIDQLVSKTERALDRFPSQTLLLGGGVAANGLLRRRLAAVAAARALPFHIPPMALCMDNGVMIAMAGALRAKQKDFTPWKRLSADPGWELVDRE